MLSLINPIKFKIKKKTEKIKLNKIKEGINCFNDFIIVKKKNNLTVFDRNCDHQGGKIISKNGQHVCPMHNWKFDPLKGTYKNGFNKQKKDYLIKKNYLVIDISEKIPKISKENTNEDTKVRFFNHAFVKVYGKNFSFATDPWAFGPAFNTGWWLKNKTKKAWIEELNNCSFIYVSHNHPDHLHPLTLARIKKDMNFIVPSFSTDSTGIYLEHLGFKNIHRLNFAHEYKLQNTNLILSILKSGDFREDSGILFSNGNFSCLFDVDSNSLNFNRYPEVDFYASSFAGGASGYPIMHENFNSAEKTKILNRNKLFLKKKKTIILKQIKPSFFFPYAGFFVEKLKRDQNVNKLQKKNNISDYSTFCKKNKINLLNDEKKEKYFFNGKKLIKSKIKVQSILKISDRKNIWTLIRKILIK